MGLGPMLLDDLLDLRRRGFIPDGARIVEIGAQQLSNGLLREAEGLARLFAAFGRPTPRLPPAGAAKMKDGVECQDAKAPPSRLLWNALGLDYCCIDYGGHLGSTVVDLNNDRVPRHMRGQFDLVVNCGTTEHVANQDNAFRVIHDLTKSGGIMYHEVPAGSWDHGLISYTPNFFTLLQRQNDYEQIILRPRRPDDMTIRSSFRLRSRRDFATPLDIPSKLFRLKNRPEVLAVRRALKIV